MRRWDLANSLFLRTPQHLEVSVYSCMIFITGGNICYQQNYWMLFVKNCTWFKYLKSNDTVKKWPMWLWINIFYKDCPEKRLSEAKRSDYQINGQLECLHCNCMAIMAHSYIVLHGFARSGLFNVLIHSTLCFLSILKKIVFIL